MRLEDIELFHFFTETCKGFNWFLVVSILRNHINQKTLDTEGQYDLIFFYKR